MAGFWAGFGTTVAKGIEDRQAFAREEISRRQEYLRNVGVPAITKRNQEVDSQVNSILQAESFGLDRAVATSLWEAGTLDVALKQVTEATDPKKTADYYNTISKLTDEYKTKAQDPASIVKKAYGIASKADVGTEEGRQAGLFDTLFALDPQATADRSMASYGVGGYTEADAAAATAGTSRTFNAPAGVAPAMAPPTAKLVTPESFKSQYNAFSNRIGAITGLEVSNTGADVILKGNSAGKAVESASLATEAFFTLYQNTDVGTANNIVTKIATKLLSGESPDYETFNSAMEAIKDGADVQSVLDQLKEDTTTPPPLVTGSGTADAEQPATLDTWGGGINFE